jgi:uncharacterized protein
MGVLMKESNRNQLTLQKMKASHFVSMVLITTTVFNVCYVSQAKNIDSSRQIRGEMYSLVADQTVDDENEVLEDIFNHNFDKLNAFLDAGGNPDRFLHSAVNNGSRAAVELMLERGANVDAVDLNNDNMTPLMVAVRYTYRVGIEMSELLIKNGANVNARASLGSTPIMFASWGTAVHYEDEYVKVIKLLIKNGAKVNVKNRMGSTPLKIARSGKWKKIANLLIKMGAKA